MQLGDLTEGLLESVTQMERFDMQSSHLGLGML